jgi:hypothetical protein
MPRGGFEPTISVSERTKTVHALDRTAAVMVSYATTVSLQILPNSLFINLSNILPYTVQILNAS